MNLTDKKGNVISESHEEFILKGITQFEDGGWSLKFDDFGFFMPETDELVPEEGMKIQMIPKGGWGQVVRGLFIEGKCVFYRTDAEQQTQNENSELNRIETQKAQFEEDREEYDMRIAALPEQFRNRLGRFQGQNADFRWEYEGYELFVSEEAVKIAAHFETANSIEVWRQMPGQERDVEFPDLSRDHSVSSFGASAYLASVYLDTPNLVAYQHGAIAGLVGCEKMGCVINEIEMEAVEIFQAQYAEEQSTPVPVEPTPTAKDLARVAYFARMKAETDDNELVENQKGA